MILNLRRSESTSNRHDRRPTLTRKACTQRYRPREESAMTVGAQEMVLREVRDGIARITLNRPAVANALAPEQRDQLIDLFQAYSRDPGVRVVVLRSTGAHFCAGADL